MSENDESNTNVELNTNAGLRKVVIDIKGAVNNRLKQLRADETSHTPSSTEAEKPKSLTQHIIGIREEIDIIIALEKQRKIK